MNILTIRNKVLKSKSLSGKTYQDLKYSLTDLLAHTPESNVKEKIQAYFLLLRVLALHSGIKEIDLISTTLESFVRYLNASEGILEQNIADAKNSSEKYTKIFTLFGSYMSAQNIFSTLKKELKTEDTLSVRNTVEMHYGRYQSKIEQFKMQHADIKILPLIGGVMSLMQGGGQKFGLILAVIIVGANILGVLIPVLFEIAPNIGNSNMYIIVGAVILLAIAIIYRIITRE